MKTLVILLAITLLSACTSPQDRLTRSRNECVGFGYKPGTTEFARCVDQQYNNPSANGIEGWWERHTGKGRNRVTVDQK